MRKITEYKITEAESGPEMEYNVNVLAARGGWKLESIAVNPKADGIFCTSYLVAVLSREKELTEKEERELNEETEEDTAT